MQLLACWSGYEIVYPRVTGPHRAFLQVAFILGGGGGDAEGQCAIIHLNILSGIGLVELRNAILRVYSTQTILIRNGDVQYIQLWG